ncbi:MAG: flagellar P-ring protein precursor FlgI [Cognaticolwellia sp.]|jgi:flagellar P-ring protein precursor FlgI
MFALLLALSSSSAHGARVKDLGYLYGTDPAKLAGIGIVVGLNGTGDSPRSEAAVNTLVAEMQSMGRPISASDLMSKNIALVYVHAELPVDARSNTRMDITVSTVADCKSLQNGVLMDTELFSVGGVKEAFAIASGPLSTGSVSASGAGDSSTRNHPTVASSPGGAQILRTHPLYVETRDALQVEYILDNPDYTTMNRLSDAVERSFGPGVAYPRDSRSLLLVIPNEYEGDFVNFMARFEQVDVLVDSVARVVINERTGTVVVGGNVSIQPVAIAHGNLLIEVSAENQVAEGADMYIGEAPTPVVVQNAEIRVTEEGGKLSIVKGGTIEDLVDALNAMGMKPRDLVIILQAIDAAGALDGELVIQ